MTAFGHDLNVKEITSLGWPIAPATAMTDLKGWVRIIYLFTYFNLTSSLFLI